MQTYASKENGVLTISFDGEKLIKQAFGVGDTVKEASKENTSFDGNLTGLLFNILQEQLKVKDKQIENLTATIKIQAENAKREPYRKQVYSVKKRVRVKPTSIPIERLTRNASDIS